MFSQEHPVNQIESRLPEPLTVPVSFFNYSYANTIGIVFKSYFHLLYVNSLHLNKNFNGKTRYLRIAKIIYKIYFEIRTNKKYTIDANKAGVISD